MPGLPQIDTGREPEFLPVPAVCFFQLGSPRISWLEWNWRWFPWWLALPR